MALEQLKQLKHETKFACKSQSLPSMDTLTFAIGVT